MPDPEIAAMGAVSDTLAQLPDDGSRARVIRWAADRFGVALGGTTRRRDGSNAGGSADVSPPDDGEETEFREFVDLFDRVNPAGEVERALTGGYWLQICKSAASWQAQQVNNLLKDTGHGVSNVTRALDGAQGRSPALVRQVSKSGRARQARKTYKLTTSGVTFIRDRLGMTSGAPEEGDD
jgi:hypothetical protein